MNFAEMHVDGCPHFFGNLKNFALSENHCGVVSRKDMIANGQNLLDEQRKQIMQKNNWTGDYMTMSTDMDSCGTMYAKYEHQAK